MALRKGGWLDGPPPPVVDMLLVWHDGQPHGSHSRRSDFTATGCPSSNRLGKWPQESKLLSTQSMQEIPNLATTFGTKGYNHGENFVYM